MGGERDAWRTANGVGQIIQRRAIDPVRLQLHQKRIAPRLKRVDPDVHRRTLLKGAHLVQNPVAKRAAQFFFQPLGVFSLHPQWFGGRRGINRGPFTVTQGLRTIAVREEFHRVFSFCQQGCDHQIARAFACHAMGEMRVTPLDRIDALGDGAPVARAGKAVTAKPGLELALQRLGGIGGKNVDHGLEPRGGGHGTRL